MTLPSPDRAVHLRPATIAVVAIGGAAGTAAREALTLAIPPAGGLPLPILLINVVGAFALGLLLEALLRRGPDTGGRRLARLAAGTGFCGGFTTYSTLAVGSAELLLTGEAGLAAGYALGTVVVGGLAAWVGVAVGAATARRRS